MSVFNSVSVNSFIAIVPCGAPQSIRPTLRCPVAISFPSHRTIGDSDDLSCDTTALTYLGSSQASRLPASRHVTGAGGQQEGHDTGFMANVMKHT